MGLRECYCLLCSSARSHRREADLWWCRWSGVSGSDVTKGKLSTTTVVTRRGSKGLKEASEKVIVIIVCTKDRKADSRRGVQRQLEIEVSLSRGDGRMVVGN